MIKVFRKIRQKLLSENKASKYFLYALGEIGLVVIGILIALQINNWNEDRKSSIQETSYLKRMLSEHKQDLITFYGSIEDLEKGKQYIEDFAEALKSVDVQDTELIQKANDYFKYGSIYPVFSSSTSTFEDLSSTGNLQVIKNSTLRESIVKHYAEHKKVKERIQIDIDWALPIDAPFTINNNILQFEPYTAFLFPDKSNNELADDLKKNKLDYINNAAAHYWVNNDAIVYFKELIEKTSDLITKLEEELR